MSRLTRQSFLGDDSEAKLARLTVGLVGLGGGNSHVVQQLAHVGVGRLVCVDFDVVEESNLNRLVGGELADVERRTLKTAVARRVHQSLVSGATTIVRESKWQDAMDALASCDIIVGGLDSYRERSELEAFCRRLLIPYIDMGMDVHALEGEYAITGQTVLSMPGQPCLWCLGILSDDRLGEEARKYGDVGGKPQVVWPNGVLASLAVGLVVQLVTPWMRNPGQTAYLEFDGNRNHVGTSNRLKAIAGRGCSHFPSAEVGDPIFDVRDFTLT
jgi:molybdopterin-synthase adenylyltransferase